MPPRAGFQDVVAEVLVQYRKDRPAFEIPGKYDHAPGRGLVDASKNCLVGHGSISSSNVPH
jgi:hypothetical protein